MRIFNMDIDFVNLRAETYAEDSRIPAIHFGTALEDARRRDFTINSMFYVLRDGRIEDLTEFGLADLRNRLIRTPLDPLVTFRDDPLRILRAIRFAARFKYDLSPEIVSAARNPEIRRALLEKVSRERVLKELEGMLSFSPEKACRPFLALFLMSQLEVFDCVFTVPQAVETQTDTQMLQSLREAQLDISEFSLEHWHRRSLAVAFACQALVTAADLCHDHTSARFLRLRKPGTFSSVSADTMSVFAAANASIPADSLLAPVSRHNYRLLFLSAAVFGLCHLNIMEKRKLISLAVVSIRDGLKADNDTAKKLAIMFDGWWVFVSMSRTPFSRVEAGLLLRRCQGEWREALALACAFEIAAHSDWDPAGIWSKGLISDLVLDQALLDIIARYRALEDVIEIRYGLEECWLVPPLLDGNEISAALAVKKGPIIGKLMEEQTRWQLEHPQGTKDQVIAHLTLYVKERGI